MHFQLRKQCDYVLFIYGGSQHAYYYFYCEIGFFNKWINLSACDVWVDLFDTHLSMFVWILSSGVCFPLNVSFVFNNLYISELLRQGLATACSWCTGIS